MKTPKPAIVATKPATTPASVPVAPRPPIAPVTPAQPIVAPTVADQVDLAAQIATAAAALKALKAQAKKVRQPIKIVTLRCPLPLFEKLSAAAGGKKVARHIIALLEVK